MISNIYIHSLSDVRTELIGENTRIWQFTVLLHGSQVGSNCNINCHCFIENDVIIGDNVTVKSGVYLWNGTRIESNVQIGPNVTFTNDLYPRAKKNFELKGIIIQEGASVGGGATLKGGITIGKYSMIGAGSVVTKSTEPFTLWYGSPARKKGYVTRGGEVVTLELIDKVGRKYKLIDGEPTLDD